MVRRCVLARLSSKTTTNSLIEESDILIMQGTKVCARAADNIKFKIKREQYFCFCFSGLECVELRHV